MMLYIKKLIRFLFRIVRNSFFYLTTIAFKLQIRIIGGHVGSNTQINGPVYLRLGTGANVQIGNQFKLNSGAANLMGRNMRASIFVYNGATLKIGNNTGASNGCINAKKRIVIDDNVKIGALSMIFDSDFHSIDPSIRVTRDDCNNAKCLPVHICDNVFIGTSCIIGKGVTVGRCSLISAGSVVMKSIPPYAIVAGNPAQVIGFSKTPKEIVEYEETMYNDEDRMTLAEAENNYNKYFLSRLEEIIKHV